MEKEMLVTLDIGKKYKLENFLKKIHDVIKYPIVAYAEYYDPKKIYIIILRDLLMNDFVNGIKFGKISVDKSVFMFVGDVSSLKQTIGKKIYRQIISEEFGEFYKTDRIDNEKYKNIAYDLTPILTKDKHSFHSFCKELYIQHKEYPISINSFSLGTAFTVCEDIDDAIESFSYTMTCAGIEKAQTSLFDDYLECKMNDYEFVWNVFGVNNYLLKVTDPKTHTWPMNQKEWFKFLKSTSKETCDAYSRLFFGWLDNDCKSILTYLLGEENSHVVLELFNTLNIESLTDIDDQIFDNQCMEISWEINEILKQKKIRLECYIDRSQKDVYDYVKKCVFLQFSDRIDTIVRHNLYRIDQLTLDSFNEYLDMYKNLCKQYEKLDQMAKPSIIHIISTVYDKDK